MKKIRILFLTMVFFLGGCDMFPSSQTTVAEDAKYSTYYRAVSRNEKWKDGSFYYSLSAQMTRLDDGSYRFYIFLDQARVAMYDIAVLAVMNDIAYPDATMMMPNIGIMGKNTYTMIPNQYDPENGFVKGLVLSGESTEASVDLKLLVEWKDKALEHVNREFIRFTLTEEGWTSSGDPQDVKGAEA